MSVSSSIPAFAFDLGLPVRTKAIPVPRQQPQPSALHRATAPVASAIATCIRFAKWS